MGVGHLILPDGWVLWYKSRTKFHPVQLLDRVRFQEQDSGGNMIQDCSSLARFFPLVNGSEILFLMPKPLDFHPGRAYS